MKVNANTLYIVLYFALFAVHFGIWKFLNLSYETVFIKYYMSLSILFIMVLTILSIMKRLYPGYIGFGFLALILVKISLMFLFMNKLDLKSVPNYKLHFIFPYMVALLLETLFAVRLIQDHTKGEKNQENEVD